MTMTMMAAKIKNIQKKQYVAKKSRKNNSKK